MADDYHSKNQNWIGISFSLADALRGDNVDQFLKIYDDLLPKETDFKQIERIKEQARILSEMDEESYQSQRRSSNSNSNPNKNNHSTDSGNSFSTSKSRINPNSSSNSGNVNSSGSKNSRSNNENWRDPNNWRLRSTEHTTSSGQPFGKSSDRQRDERGHRRSYGSGSNEHKFSPDKRSQSRNKTRKNDYLIRGKSGRGNRGHRENSIDGSHRTSSPSPSRLPKVEPSNSSEMTLEGNIIDGRKSSNVDSSPKIITDQELKNLDDNTSRGSDEGHQTITNEPPFGFPPSESQLLQASTDLLSKVSVEVAENRGEDRNLEATHDSVKQLKTTAKDNAMIHAKNKASQLSNNHFSSEGKTTYQNKSIPNSFMHKEAADYLFQDTAIITERLSISTIILITLSTLIHDKLKYELSNFFRYKKYCESLFAGWKNSLKENHHEYNAENGDADNKLSKGRKEYHRVYLLIVISEVRTSNSYIANMMRIVDLG
ncbi:uncharacterized protein TRIADDRAFT_59043 [Trichoplax adhaerens]|uniref:Uncharacterized protein n=1 Tax=Trichoplax adhaerens TaxID=10228 RepID=B3S4D2_TRIAD|nr:hypothetical protein TRIADDRAFT_59043 [Trichoplax adhaerens]EDV22619.1 hypothetical protein TRIADDRAFT_59043 [Trichoplax adhaerens]|eukprot:XP_002115163.1 hypothetical protein TRIADDRAFT_59043 [Trichoplax adhaerens]